MTEEKMRPNRLDWELVGEPIIAGERTIQPVARLSGWAGGNMSEQGGGAGAWVRVRPVEVVVREADGTESRVPIVDAERLLYAAWLCQHWRSPASARRSLPARCFSVC